MNKNTRTTAKRAAATAALGLGLVAGGAGLASATTHSAGESARDATTATTATPAPPGSPPDMAGGVVTAITASSITVKDLSGMSTTYAITSATTFAEGPTAIDSSQVIVGEHVAVATSSSDTTTATSVNVMPVTLVGTVTSRSADTVVITDSQGFSRTIVVDSSTAVTASGAASSLADVTVGAVIVAQGTVDANATSLDASSIAIGLTGHTNGAGPGVGGPGPGGPGLPAP